VRRKTALLGRSAMGTGRRGSADPMESASDPKLLFCPGRAPSSNSAAVFGKPPGKQQLTCLICGSPMTMPNGPSPQLPQLPPLCPAERGTSWLWGAAGLVPDAPANHPCRAQRRTLVSPLDGPAAAATAHQPDHGTRWCQRADRPATQLDRHV
jgi:hypothetical protein